MGGNVTSGYLGIDAGTQGLSVVFTDRQLKVLAIAEAAYEMLPNLPDGCYEQAPSDWLAALEQAMHSLKTALPIETGELEVLAIGVSGQMHGEVLADNSGEPLGPVRLWCDSRNEAEAAELTKLFGVKMPKRITAARWLWTIRNDPIKAKQVTRLTTPAGWLAYKLTGTWNLGIGDAAGMFPIDQETLNYDKRLIDLFNKLVGSGEVATLESILPNVLRAGENAGALHEGGARVLGLSPGVPVAAAEGDQPASLAGSLIGDAGMVSISFGTSVCANSVGDRVFQGVEDAVDHFCAADGKPINMVWLRNGTTFMNSVVNMFGASGGSLGFEHVMQRLLEADPDCGGILALPFMDDEPGLGVRRGGTAMLIGLNSENATPGNLSKAALLATMYNLKLGCQVLDERGFPRSELVLAGGLTRTPQLGQILADVFDTKVTLLESAQEGTAWGAAVLARFRHAKIQGDDTRWTTYLARLAAKNKQQFQPQRETVNQYAAGFERYRRLLATLPDLDNALSESQARSQNTNTEL